MTSRTLFRADDQIIRKRTACIFRLELSYRSSSIHIQVLKWSRWKYIEAGWAGKRFNVFHFLLSKDNSFQFLIVLTLKVRPPSVFFFKRRQWKFKFARRVDRLWNSKFVFNIEFTQSGVVPFSLLKAIEHLFIHASIKKWNPVKFIKHSWCACCSFGVQYNACSSLLHP